MNVMRAYSEVESQFLCTLNTLNSSFKWFTNNASVCVCVCVCVCVRARARVCTYTCHLPLFQLIASILGILQSKNVLITVLVTTSHSNSKEISRILHSLKTHGHIQNIPLLVPVIYNILDTQRGFVELPATPFWMVFVNLIYNCSVSAYLWKSVSVLSLV
jgi:hypothetical protein